MVPPSAEKGPRRAAWLVLLISSVSLTVLSGCASPGAPRPPSLQLPERVTELVASRSGDSVEIRFTAPARTSDGLPLRSGTMHASLCRQITAKGACVPVIAQELVAPMPDSPGVVRAGNEIVWQDNLSEALRTGVPQLLVYRVDLQNDKGRSAGPSNAAYVAAGETPPVVTGVFAQGTRKGVLLEWTPISGAGEILLERQQLGTSPQNESAVPQSAAQPEGSAHRAHHDLPGSAAKTQKRTQTEGTTWLQADPGDASAAHTLDSEAAESVPYRYTLVRRQFAQIGGRKLELRSAPSASVTFTWHDIYPPASPQGLTALGFSTGASQNGPTAYAVDLVWEPVDDTRLAGYLVQRTPLTIAGEPSGNPEPLTPTPLLSPAFHDATANASTSYRYEVIAVDGKGNKSAPATAVVKASR